MSHTRVRELTLSLQLAAMFLFANPAVLYAQDHSTMHDAATTDSALMVMGHAAGENATVKSEVTAVKPLQPGSSSPMLLTLKDAQGQPVTPDDLVEMHTKKVHLLVVDPSLGDYHHIHPQPTSNPGEYSFDLTPEKSGKYLFFADLVPVKSHNQEYSISSLEVPGTPAPVIKQQDRSVKVNGFTFDLSFDKPELVQGDSIRATLKVTGPDGQPFKKLEPVMGAFAHMVAFSEDRSHVAHIHPQGKEPEKAEDRGGPELTFYMNITQPGYHLLYSQVQIDGKDVFAPFGLQIKPREVPNTVSGIFSEIDLDMDRLENVIQSGKLAQVHGLAFWIRDLLTGLKKVTDLPPGSENDLQMSLKRIQSYADLLDRYGDSGQLEQTNAVFGRFKEEIDKIRATVKAPAPSKDSASAKAVGNTNCPVSKMPVGSMEPGAAIVYNGHKIGLCCSGCKETFQKDPEGYLKKALQSINK